MKFEDKVRELMKNSGINQKELSKKSGVSESSLCRYLSGSLKPRIDIIANIAKVFGLNPSDLINDDENLKKDFNIYDETLSVVTRNRKELTDEQKAAIVKALFGGDWWMNLKLFIIIL